MQKKELYDGNTICQNVQSKIIVENKFRVRAFPWKFWENGAQYDTANAGIQFLFIDDLFIIFAKIKNAKKTWAVKRKYNFKIHSETEETRVICPFHDDYFSLTELRRSRSKKRNIKSRLEKQFDTLKIPLGRGIIFQVNRAWQLPTTVREESVWLLWGWIKKTFMSIAEIG